MIRVTVSYPAKEGARFDHDYYRTKHRQLILDKLGHHGLQAVDIDRCIADGMGKAPPVLAAAHMIFDKLESFQHGMAAHGKEIMADVANYSDLRPSVVVSEMA